MGECFGMARCTVLYKNNPYQLLQNNNGKLAIARLTLQMEKSRREKTIIVDETDVNFSFHSKEYCLKNTLCR